MTRPLHLSATSISNFKACPTRFLNANVLGIREIIPGDALRIGTNWHSVLELDDVEAVVEHLNKCYDEMPTGVDMDKMDVERATLLHAYLGYKWYYPELPETLVAETRFKMGLINPESRRSQPNVKLVGIVDKLVRLPNGKIAVKEHKSTSSSVDADSRYWAHLTLDTQTTLYVYAARRLQVEGGLVEFGIMPNDEPINTVLYDVWKKPGIKPKKLTQGDSKKFVETGEYCGQKFEVEFPATQKPALINPNEGDVLKIGGVRHWWEPGAKEGTLSIRETADMYGARLLADIGERPEYYFACREITKTDDEIARFESELLDIYRTIQNMKRSGHWYHNEHQCEATFKCRYIDSCYTGQDLDPDNPPLGFECIFNKEKLDDNDSTTDAPAQVEEGTTETATEGLGRPPVPE